MPATYQLIASNTLSSAAASVTFSSIPATYTDLVVRISARSDRSGSNVDVIFFRFNGISTTVYSDTAINGTGAVADNGRSTNATTMFNSGYFAIPAATSTSSTFSSMEIYIPSYGVSQNKPLSGFSVSENNSASSGAFITADAGLWRSTATISSIEFSLNTGPNFVSGSSFFLYGIKNS